MAGTFTRRMVTTIGGVSCIAQYRVEYGDEHDGINWDTHTTVNEDPLPLERGDMLIWLEGGVATFEFEIFRRAGQSNRTSWVTRTVTAAATNLAPLTERVGRGNTPLTVGDITGFRARRVT